MHTSRVNETDIQAIQPYAGNIFREGMRRIAASPALPLIAERYFKGMSPSEIARIASGIGDANEFQRLFIVPGIATILAQTSKGLTVSGFENNPHDRRYVFVSNHRDIICDPGIFNYAQMTNGWPTAEICLGDNLLTSQIIVDLVKTNKGVTVKRNLSQRELFRWSTALSELIQRQVRTGTESVWIAQREGRTKDGRDETHPGVIKMLSLVGEGPLLDRIQGLHIVPVAISYEFDPCDILKARELQLTARHGSYSKAADEDQISMMRGINGSKGRIHLSIGREISDAVELARTLPCRKTQVESIAAAVDEQIWSGYRNWPTNFIAADLCSGTSKFSDRYTTAERQEFIERMEKRISGLHLAGDEATEVRQFFLRGYANSVRGS